MPSQSELESSATVPACQSYEELEAKYKRIVSVLKNIVTVDRGGLPETCTEADRKLDRIRSAGEKARDVLREVGELPPKT